MHKQTNQQANKILVVCPGPSSNTYSVASLTFGCNRTHVTVESYVQNLLTTHKLKDKISWIRPKFI